MDDPMLETCETRHASVRGRADLERWRHAGSAVERLVVHHPGAVAIIVQPEPDQLLLVRQFRYALRRWTLEIPAGTRAPGEDPETTARRELEEETGLIAGRVVELMRMIPAPGLSDEELVLYRAEDCRPGRFAPDPGEALAVERVALAELPALRRAGLVCDAKTLIALGLIGCAGAVAC